MENEKKNACKTTAIVILILLLLGAVGYLSYDKINQSENQQAYILKTKNSIKNLKNKVKSLEDENQKLASENESLKAQKNNTQTQTNNTMTGKYSAKKTISGDVTCTYTADLNLNADGTYTYESGCDCGGGFRANGKYTIGTNSIKLHDNNSNTDFEISYSNEVLVTTKTCGSIKLEMTKQN